MRTLLCLSLLIILLLTAHSSHSQGWRARAVLNFNSGSNPLATVDNVTVSFSGKTIFGWSATSTVSLDLTGTGAPSGALQIYASGRSAVNYDQIAYVTVTFEGPFEANCDNHYLDLYGTASEHVTGTFTVYPRLEISHFTEECNLVRLTTDICAPHYTWEVSENHSGPFKTIRNTNTSGISVTGEDLQALGLTNYGQKYFRVSGLVGTTSPIVPVYVFAPGPDASFTLVPPNCHDGDDGAIMIEIESAYPEVINDFVVSVFEQGGSSLQFYPNDTDEVLVTGLEASTYRITIENNTSVSVYGGCQSEFTTGPIANPPKVELQSVETSNYNGYEISCHDASDGFVKITAAGGTGQFTSYTWTPNVSSTSTATDLSSGTYTVKVTDSKGCESDLYPTVLNQPERLFVEILSSGGNGGYDVSCYNKHDGEIQAIPAGGVPDYTFVWSNGLQTAAITGIGTGSYQVAVSDGNGCRTASAITLSAPQPIDFDIQQVSEIRCAGEKTGAIEVHSIKNTIGDVFYRWSTGESGASVSGKEAGEFSVTVSDSHGCSQTKTTYLEEPPLYAVELGTDADFNGMPIRCNGESNASIGAVVKDENGMDVLPSFYTWYKTDIEILSGSALSRLDNIAAGSYSVKVEYNEGCEAHASLKIAEPDPLVALAQTVSDFNGLPISCFGADDGEIHATATGGTGEYTFVWNTGTTGDAVRQLEAGEYSVTVTDANGCQAIAATTISEPEPVTAQIQVMSDFNGWPISCSQASDGHLRATAEGGTSMFTFAWSSGAITPEISGLDPGQYSVNVKDGNGCQASRDIVIEAPEPLNISVIEKSDYNGFGVSCHTSEDGFLRAAASGGAGSYQYSWLESEHSDSLHQHLPAGIWSVMVTDQNGCTATSTAELSAPEPLVADLIKTKEVSCNGGNDGEMELRAYGGAGGYRYAISGLSPQAEGLLSGLEAGEHALVITDINGCTQRLRHTLNQPAPLTIEFSEIEPALCGDPRGSINASVRGGAGVYEYRWTESDHTVLGSTPQLVNLLPGVYTLTVTDQNFCEATRSTGITATDGPLISMDIIQLPTCAYTADGQVLASVTEGNGPYAFRWQNGQTAPLATQLGPGEHLIEVVDASGCPSVGNITLTAPRPIQIDVSEKSEPRCNGECNGILRVSASGGTGALDYIWKEFTGPEIKDLCSGQYELKVKDEQGCYADTVFLLGEPEPLETILQVKKNPMCPDGCDGYLKVDVTGGTGSKQYLWSNGKTNRETGSLCEGSYSVTITDAHDCNTAETFTLIDPQESKIDLGGSATICTGQSFTLDAGPTWKKYSWESSTGFKSSAQTVTLNSGGLYWVEVTSINGCHTRDTFLLKTSDQLLTANFLLASEALVTDTVVAIDISWPLPDRIIWNLPNDLTIIEDQGDIVYGVFEDEGQYDITLLATLGACRDAITKMITILGEEKTGHESGRLSSEPFVRKFSLYPNPNDGVFDVEVEFRDKTPVTFSVWNTLRSTQVTAWEDTGSALYRKHVDLRPLAAGTYTLRMDYEKRTKFVRFIVR